MRALSKALTRGAPACVNGRTLSESRLGLSLEKLVSCPSLLPSWHTGLPL